MLTKAIDLNLPLSENNSKIITKMTIELIKIIAIAFFIPIIILSLWSWSLVFRRGFRIKIIKDKIYKVEYYKPIYYRQSHPEGMDYLEAFSICVNEEKEKENKTF